MDDPPGLEQNPRNIVTTRNRYALLREKDVVEIGCVEIDAEAKELGSLDVEVPHVCANALQRKTGRMRSAGKGKITIGSGAGESVMPKEMLPNEELVEGLAKKSGVRYVAANGSKMDNYGEKRVRFRQGEDEVLNSIVFQSTDVRKPLAAVSKINDKNNKVVFDKDGSYILNKKTGRRIELLEERGTFVMEVEFLEPELESEAPGVTRRGA